MIQAAPILVSAPYPAASKAAPRPIHSRENLQSVWHVWFTSQAGEVCWVARLYRSHRQSTKANVPLPDIFTGGFILARTVAYCFGSSCISITSHDWNIPPEPMVSFRVQIQLVWRSDDWGPLTAPYAQVESVPSFSCFPSTFRLGMSVCLCVSGEQPQETPKGIERHIFA